MAYAVGGVVLTWLAVSYFVRLQGEAQRQAISSYVLRNAAPLPGTAAVVCPSDISLGHD
ncbi:hypothetical protein TIFTF001_037737 [Ficus carica]|uniref:Uncharacterized protein n=1 Tax=Ficus carica TaxID=3494 RepID=A0AA88E6J0_FICCA|nr:hypothetical protein TIFTF001_037737 [Ficus carica]